MGFLTATYRPTSTGRTARAFWLALANFVSFSATLVIASCLSRLLSPADYGTYRQVILVYYTFLMVFSMGLPKAYSYFLAKAPVEEGRSIVLKFGRILLALALFFSIALWCGADVMAWLLGNDMLAPHLRCFALTPLFLMPVLGVEGILTAYGMTNLVAAYVFAGRVLLIAGAVIPVAWFGAGVTGAVNGFVIASFASCVFGVWLSFRPFKGIGSCKTEIKIKDVFKFVWPIFTSGIYGFVIMSSSQFFVSHFFGVKEFAFFANGYHELPFAGMVFGATAGVLLPEYSKMVSESDSSARMRALWKSVVIKTCLLIYPMSVYCCFFAPEIMAFLYGADYRLAAVLFIIATVVCLLRVVPFNPVMLATGNAKRFSDLHLATALMIIVLDVLCVNYFPSLFAIAVIGSGCIMYCQLMLMCSVARTFGITLRRLMPWRFMLKILVLSIIAGFFARGVTSMWHMTDVFPVLVISSVVFLLVYFPLAMWRKLDYSWVLSLRRTSH